LAHMLDLLPDGVVYYQAVRDESMSIIDFQLAYYNQHIADLTASIYALKLGIYLIRDNPVHSNELQPLFAQYRKVVNNGLLEEFDYYDPIIGLYFSLRINKLQDGVLVTSRRVDKTEMLRIEKQATMLRNILDGSINGIMSYRSIRNERGDIIDFELQAVNKAAEEMLEQRAEEIIGKTLTVLYPEGDRDGVV